MIKAYKVQITGIISITDRGMHPSNWDVESLAHALTDGAIDLQITELVEPEQDRMAPCDYCGSGLTEQDPVRSDDLELCTPCHAQDLALSAEEAKS